MMVKHKNYFLETQDQDVVFNIEKKEIYLLRHAKTSKGENK